MLPREIIEGEQLGLVGREGCYRARIVVREAFRLAGSKLSVSTSFVKRQVR